MKFSKKQTSMGLQVTITTSKISTKLQTQVYHMKTCHRWIQAHIVSTGQSPDKFRNLTIYADKNQGGFVFSGNISGSIRLVIYIYAYDILVMYILEEAYKYIILIPTYIQQC